MAYDAVAFLERLFGLPAETATDDGRGIVAVTENTRPGIVSPDDLPGDWRVDWEERAAIMEYDGGLPRERAEALALDIIVRQMRRAGIGVRQT